MNASPELATAWALLAQAQLFGGAPPSEVRKSAKVAEKLCARWAYPLNLMGNAYNVEDKTEEAEVAYRGALGLAPKYVQPRFNLALLSMKKKDFAGAVEQLTTLLGHQPHHKNGHLLRGTAHYYLKNFGQAAGDAREAIKRDAKNANGHQLLGQALSAQGQAAEANASFCRAKALGHPEDHCAPSTP